MEESETIPICRLEKKSERRGKPGAWLCAVLLFLPFVFLLVLSFYAWQLKTVFVVEGEEGETKKQFFTLCRTVGGFLEKNELQVGLYDRLDPAPNEIITDGQVIRIQKAFPVTLVVNGEVRKVWTCSSTTGELLKEQGIMLDEEETVRPLSDTVLRSRTRQEVSVVHVGSRGGLEENRSASEAPAVGEKNDTFNTRDYPALAGETGLAEGPASTGGLLSTEGSLPVDDPVGIDESVPVEDPLPGKDDLVPAAKAVPDRAMAEDNILAHGGQTYRYLTSLEVSATAYCPGTPGSGCPIDARGASQCTGFYNDGYTATGVAAVPGDGSIDRPHLVAVDPSAIPLKSLLYLEGYGFARAEDTGAAIKGKSIDILFAKHEEARIFGRQRLKIYLLDPHFAPNFR